MTFSQVAFRWSYRMQVLDYRIWLPVSARMPLPVGLAMARWRGWLNRRWHRDWAELSVGFPYVAQRAFLGYGLMYPAADDETRALWVLGRYQTIAREEFEAQLAISGRLLRAYTDWPDSALADLAARRTPGRGLVVVAPHLDNSFLIGVALARCLSRVHFLVSSVVEHPKVHSSARRFFREKYAAYERLLQGGRYMYTSRETKAFVYAALQRGEAVVMLTDAPADTDSEGCWVPWFGASRKVPVGSLRMAMATGSEMVAMSCVWAAKQRLECSVSDVVDPGSSPWGPVAPAVAQEAYRRLFGFMESCIRRKPQGWLAVHLMGDYAVDPA